MASITKTTPLKKRLSLYSDFHTDFTKNPLTDDLAVKRDEEAVKQSMRNLIMTDRGERPFQPRLGSDVRRTLFENMTPATIKVLEEQIRSTINNYEPRANVFDINIIADYPKNRVRVNIYYYLRNAETPLTAEFVLERTR